MYKYVSAHPNFFFFKKPPKQRGISLYDGGRVSSSYKWPAAHVEGLGQGCTQAE